MKEFTLLTVLNSITRHLLVTVVLFVVTYWSLSSLNIIDDQSEHIISFGSRDALILPEGELAATGKELVND